MSREGEVGAPSGAPTGPDAPTRASWERFTLLDLTLVVLCCALGLGAVRLLADPVGPRDWPLAALIGAILFGPAEALVQIGRGRRERPSAGEWIWLLEALTWIAGLALFALGSKFETARGHFWGLIIFPTLATYLLAIAGAVFTLQWLFNRVFGHAPSPTSGPLRWTSVIGALIGWMSLIIVNI